MCMNRSSINNLINHITSIREGSYKTNKICVLIGAGADITSGGILFRELKLRLLEENGCPVPRNVIDKTLDELFENQVARMSQDSRCETLDKIMRKHKEPSEGYLLLVMLAELGYINAVITTNFDYLLEEAQKTLNVNPFTIFSPGKSIPEEYYKRCQKISPLYLKMHGDLSDRLVTHLTESEIKNKKYGESFIELLRYIIQSHSLIVVGYSGYDTLIAEIFKQEINNIADIYWCNVSEPNTDSILANILKLANKFYYIKTSFDELFQDIAKVFLKNEKLKNTNPVFLPTVVQSKINNQISIFTEKIRNKDNLIKRKEENEALEKFLSSFDNKCVAIIGEPHFGKTCFVYKAMQTFQDVTFLPITYDQKHTVLESIALAVGYDTDVPFPILYNFLKWRNGEKGHLVIIIDDFFNNDYFHNASNNNQIIDFLNFLYIAREFKYIQFLVCFQKSIYDYLESSETFSSFGNIISGKIFIRKFSEAEVEKLLVKIGVNNKCIDALKKQDFLQIPYVWENLSRNCISIDEQTDFLKLYTDTIYKTSVSSYSFTKHAFNKILQELSYKQIFAQEEIVDEATQEYIFLQDKGIINADGRIMYSELAIYFCKQYLLSLHEWEQLISSIIVPYVEQQKDFSEEEIEVYASILSEIGDINDFTFVFNALNNIITFKNETFGSKKLVIKALQKCAKFNLELFECYLKTVDLSDYSLNLQYSLFKICVELCPQVLSLWSKRDNDSKLAYAAFILRSDNIFSIMKGKSDNMLQKDKVLPVFASKNGLIRLCHILTYWGWDNTSKTEYQKLKKIIIDSVLPIIRYDDKTIKDFVDILINYSYNIFFNAGEDFEEKFIVCQNSTIHTLINNVLEGNVLTKEEYLELLEINTDINNSWLFIISNIIVVKSMKNNADKTYNMLDSFWDNVQFPVFAQHLDFYLSSAFWSLYISIPYDRIMFVTLFKKIIDKYDLILFMLPTTERKASICKFEQEFEQRFEDGFNPLAFYFYTAPYESIANNQKWECGKKDLKIYWDLAINLADLGKYDDILRIVHALGQMISIYPMEGYSALENIAKFEHPIIKKGLVRIFKENYLRYGSITKEELEKSIFNFTSSEKEEIIYNFDFLLENRTMEQLHWGRLFYNLEQLFKVDVSEKFLSVALTATSCRRFLYDFIKNFLS